MRKRMQNICHKKYRQPTVAQSAPVRMWDKDRVNNFLSFHFHKTSYNQWNCVYSLNSVLHHKPPCDSVYDDYCTKDDYLFNEFDKNIIRLEN